MDCAAAAANVPELECGAAGGDFLTYMYIITRWLVFAFRVC